MGGGLVLTFHTETGMGSGMGGGGWDEGAQAQDSAFHVPIRARCSSVASLSSQSS